MSNPLRFLFKGRLSIDKTFDAVVKAGDKLMFTKQEKAQFDAKLADAMAEHAKATLNESTVRSITRRFIAIFLIVNIIIIFWLCVVLALLGYDITVILELSNNLNLGIVFITIIAFFFGGYYFTTYKKKEP